MESKYKFEDFTNGLGFRIFRLKEHVSTVYYRDGGFNTRSCKKTWVNTSKFNIFNFFDIIKQISIDIALELKRDNQPYFWIVNKIGKSLAKKISFKLKQIINKIPKDIVNVSKRFFNINIRSPRLYIKNLTKYDINQIKKYRAAAYSYSKICGDKPKNFNWRKNFGKLDKIQKEILLNLPGNISIGLVMSKLANTKFEKPILNRTELLIRLIDQNFLNKTSVKEFKEAMKIYNPLSSIRKTKDIQSFICDLDSSNIKCENIKDKVILMKEKNENNIGCAW